MNKLLILSVMAFFAALMPVVPALACFPNADDTEEVLFQTETAFQFGRDPLPMSYCSGESGEGGFVIVKGKCYDEEAILDFDTEEGCQADEICNAYREEQRKAEEKEREPRYDSCGCRTDIPGYDCPLMVCDLEEPVELTDDPNHGEIKGDEELEQNEEEHQEEEEQGEEESEETTQETFE